MAGTETAVRKSNLHWAQRSSLGRSSSPGARIAPEQALLRSVNWEFAMGTFVYQEATVGFRTPATPKAPPSIANGNRAHPRRDRQGNTESHRFSLSALIGRLESARTRMGHRSALHREEADGPAEVRECAAHLRSPSLSSPLADRPALLGRGDQCLSCGTAMQFPRTVENRTNASCTSGPAGSAKKKRVHQPSALASLAEARSSDHRQCVFPPRGGGNPLQPM